MTRKKEINQQAEKYRQPYRDGGYRLSSKDIRDAFEEGAKWADKTMLDRMLKYLEAEHPTFFEHFGEEIRKTMEE